MVVCVDVFDDRTDEDDLESCLYFHVLEKDINLLSKHGDKDNLNKIMMMLFERLYKWLGKYVNCPLSLCNVKHFPFAYFLHIFTIKIRPYTQPGQRVEIHDPQFSEVMMIMTVMVVMINNEDVDHLLFFCLVLFLIALLQIVALPSRLRCN